MTHIRTLSTYTSILEIKSKSTQKLFQCTLNNIKEFGKLNTKNISLYSEDDLYDRLQDWIIWNTKRGLTTSSIITYFNAFKSYLNYQGMLFNYMNPKQNLKFPRALYSDQIPVTADEIKKILCVSKTEFRFQLLALISSGMRVGELGQIRRNNIDLTRSNIMVRISAEMTKTGRPRVTFFSKQVSDMIRYRIKSHNVDFIFCGNRTKNQSLNLILKRFAISRRKANLTDKHNHCHQNRYKIHVHSMRSYFITKANKIQFGLGHTLAGHNFYMKEYNRYTVDELYDMYRKFEEELTFRNI